MELSLCSYSFHHLLEAGKHDVFQYMSDCRSLGCTQLDLLQGRVDLLPSAELALNTMLISEGIYRSSQLGCEVTADEVRERSVSLSLGEGL